MRKTKDSNILPKIPFYEEKQSFLYSNVSFMDLFPFPKNPKEDKKSEANLLSKVENSRFS